MVVDQGGGRGGVGGLVAHRFPFPFSLRDGNRSERIYLMWLGEDAPGESDR